MALWKVRCLLVFKGLCLTVWESLQLGYYEMRGYMGHEGGESQDGGSNKGMKKCYLEFCSNQWELDEAGI